MKKLLYMAFATLVLSTTSMAYDQVKADQLNKFYSHMNQKACAKSKLFIKAVDVMKMLRENKKFTILDVRTDGEASIISISASNAIHIPISELFKKENLNKLPKDEPIVIVCHSGTRATLAAIGLKQIGFKKSHVLKGGLIALATANNPKNAPLK